MVMKKVMFLLCTLTLLIANQRSYGQQVFGGPSFHFTNLDKQSAWGAGGFGGYYFTPKFYLGGAGYGINTADFDENETSIGYGGVFMGYTWVQSGKLSFNTEVLAGLGGVDHKASGLSEDDGIGIVNLTALIERKVSEILKLGLGLGYRHVYDLDMASINYQDISGFTVDIVFRFGKFNGPGR